MIMPKISYAAHLKRIVDLTRVVLAPMAKRRVGWLTAVEGRHPDARCNLASGCKSELSEFVLKGAI
jgi:hypothetical protein